ncbi:MAG: outer membrane lipoprotein carrier protein LolA [Planctomycetota bacterium]
MNDRLTNPDRDRLDDAVRAMRDTPTPPTPPTEQTVRWLESIDDGRADRTFPFPFSRKTIMRIAPPLSAAAAIIVGVVVFAVMTASPRVAFADVVDKLREIQTASFVLIIDSTQGKTVLRSYVKQPNLMRQESSAMGQKIINVYDFDAGRMVTLLPDARMVNVVDMKNLTSEAPFNIIDEVGKISDEDAEFIGEETVDGLRLLRYDFVQGDFSGKLWVDPETSLLYRSVMTSVGPNGDESTIISEDFVWNPPLDSDLFDLTVPDGYRPILADDSPPQAADVAAVLRLYAYANDGVFPDDFNAFSLFNVVEVMNPPGMTPQERREFWIGFVEEVTGIQAPEPEVLRAEGQWLSGRISKAGILLGFAMESDYHWTGRGVTAGDADTIVCYWRSMNGDGYTVVRGDFSVETGVPKPEID